MITSRPRSPGDVDGPPRKRQRVSDAQRLREIHRTGGAANIAGSIAAADPMVDIVANFDDSDVDMESIEDSDPESRKSDFDDRPESQYIDEGLSALRINEVEVEVANRSMATFSTYRTSRGATVYNINGDYVIHNNFQFMPGCTPSEEIFKNIYTTSSAPSRSVAQSRYYSGPPSDRMTKIYVAADPVYDSAIISIDRVRVMISIVKTMMANPMLCPSEDLPETLASLERLLTLMELALRAYRHTDLAHSLSRAIAIGVEECHRLLDELINNLANFRQVLSSAVLYFIRKYMWARIGWQGSAIDTLDSKLRKSHSSFAACLLALGRAAWPELQRGQGQQTLDALAKFYVQLEQESTSLRHIEVDAVIVRDHLERRLCVPMIFCTSSQDFHVVIAGFCRGVAGDALIQQRNYRILNSEDDQVINPEEFAIVLQPGMAVGMSIVYHEQAEERQGSEGYSCPRCQHVNSRCTGWVTCAKCNGSFKISPEEESIVYEAENNMRMQTPYLTNDYYSARFRFFKRVHRTGAFG
ncbi:hypothetical protein FIBSPDRAFT_867187 [Athelia psychrophila]|uniref:Ubiquitin-like domain-containing protein n=1 Tax=Athelia psychrophila TaxID=1759441 RepID=A0A166E655_9AGAM|nr:hypothetical protein FIBSPDRAFT_867187 [Fibularhizoctonia sp. CBS 109695]